MTVNLVSVDVVAQLFDLKRRRIQQLAQEGIIPRSEGGKYPLAASIQGYIRHLREKALGGDESEDSYGNQRARLTRARANIAEMERDQLAAELIPANDVEAAWRHIELALRERLVAIPAKAAPRLLGAKDAVAIGAIVREEICEALDELANVRVEVSEPIWASDARLNHDRS